MTTIEDRISIVWMVGICRLSGGIDVSSQRPILSSRNDIASFSLPNNCFIFPINK